jgi:tetratricopeptide (TPR) repeat protein
MHHEPPGRPPIGPGRRRPRRPSRRVPPRPPRRLIRANALMEQGRHAEAAELFVRLSEGARRRGMPVRAAHLTVRASHALLADQRPQEAIEQLDGALRVLVSQGQVHRAAQVASRATVRLREKGFETEAVQLEQQTQRLREELALGDDAWEAPPSPGPGPARESLPNRCAGCGAPLVPDEVVWHQARSAECPYCGSIVTTR